MLPYLRPFAGEMRKIQMRISRQKRPFPAGFLPTCFMASNEASCRSYSAGIRDSGKKRSPLDITDNTLICSISLALGRAFLIITLSVIEVSGFPLWSYHESSLVPLQL